MFQLVLIYFILLEINVCELRTWKIVLLSHNLKLDLGSPITIEINYEFILIK